MAVVIWCYGSGWCWEWWWEAGSQGCKERNKHWLGHELVCHFAQEKWEEPPGGTALTVASLTSTGKF